MLLQAGNGYANLKRRKKVQRLAKLQRRLSAAGFQVARLRGQVSANLANALARQLAGVAPRPAELEILGLGFLLAQEALIRLGAGEEVREVGDVSVLIVVHQRAPGLELALRPAAAFHLVRRQVGAEPLRKSSGSYKGLQSPARRGLRPAQWHPRRRLLRS